MKHDLRSTSPSFLWLCLGILWLVLGMSGCQPNDPASRAFATFQQHLQRQQHDQAWRLLSKSSRVAFERLAKRASKRNGLTLFRTLRLSRTQRLRPDPVFRPHRQGDKMTLHYRTPLNQRVQFTMRYESKAWRFVMAGQWLSPAQHHPSTKPTTRATNIPNAR